ncbi:MAG: DUF3348 family protein [Oleiphilus sp.]
MSQISQKSKMKKPSGSDLLGHSELIRRVQSLLAKDIPRASGRFSERLTQNMDFSSSLKLSEIHGQLRLIDKRHSQSAQTQGSSADLAVKAESVQAALSRVKRSILLNIEQSFDDQTKQARFPLPVLCPEAENLDFSVYENFYLAHQKEMSAKIQGLRSYICETMSAASPTMAKLVLLDKTLEETIGLPLRRGFSALNFVMQQHAQVIQTACHDSKTNTKVKQQSIDEFHVELHQFLLAELELRLQPIHGLLAAFTQEVKE